MLPTASATLITNLTASLADADHRWVVVRCQEKRSGQAFATVKQSGGGVNTYNVQQWNAGAPQDITISIPALQAETVTGAGTIETEIHLVATKVRLKAGGQQFLELTYLSVWVAGAFSYGELRFNDGAAFRHTNATLDTDIRTKALALMTARQTPLEDTLEDGDASANPLAMPSTLLAALLASLADETHGWHATAVSMSSFGGVDNFTCSLAAGEALKSAVSSVVPASFSYVAQLNALGTIIDAKVYSGVGGVWRTFDTDLYDAIKDMADAFQAAQAANLEGGLEAGPQP